MDHAIPDLPLWMCGMCNIIAVVSSLQPFTLLAFTISLPSITVKMNEFMDLWPGFVPGFDVDAGFPNELTVTKHRGTRLWVEWA